MKAIVYDHYGEPDVLQLQEVETPIPKEDEVLIKVHAAALNAVDTHIISGKPYFMRAMFGWLKPRHKIPGIDVAGTVVAIGSKITQFKPGDEVFGDMTEAGFGAFAEYTCAPESAIELKPANITFIEAAAFPLAGNTALQAIHDKGDIHKGDKVLINGASGGVGSYAIELAKYFGAEVTAVCSTDKMEIAHDLGADHIIDYTKEDFTKNDEHYDVILGINGYHPIADYKKALNPNGHYVASGGSGKQLMEPSVLGPFLMNKEGKMMDSLSVKPNKKNLTYLKGLIEKGKIKAVIDRIFKLEELPEAIRYLSKGHARGKIVIRIG